eukprot:6747486-Prymnesium_polylepis.1
MHRRLYRRRPRCNLSTEVRGAQTPRLSVAVSAKQCFGHAAAVHAACSRAAVLHQPDPLLHQPAPAALLQRLASHGDEVDAVAVARAVGQIVAQVRAVDADALATAEHERMGVVGGASRLHKRRNTQPAGCQPARVRT